jgi:alpha-amylase
MKTLKLWLLILLLCFLPLAAASGISAAYEVFAGSYCDSDGDGTGDLNGIRSKLDYIQALGVDCLWLTPVTPSPSYHKYDVTDYKDIDPSFGTLADFDALAADCEARGIALLFDLAVNHTSAKHPWFTSAVESLKNGDETNPYIGYYQFTRGVGDHPVEGTDWYYAGDFGADMPELNLDSEAVRGEIANIIAFWLAHGVGGFRLDAVTHYYDSQPESSRAFVAWFCDTVKGIDPDAFIVGEAWTDEAAILGLYQSGIDALFNFPLSSTGALTNAMHSEAGQSFAKRIVSWWQSIEAVNPDAVAAPFLSNHDQGRIAGVLVNDLQREKQAAALYLLSPGVPFIYYGEEIGMTGSGDDPNKRLPMLWSATDSAGMCAPPEGASQVQRLKTGADAQESDPDSLLSFYRQVLALRDRYPVFVHGTAAVAETSDSRLAAFTLTDGGQALLIAHNFASDEALFMPSHGTLAAMFNTGDVASIPSEDGVLIAPLSTAVWIIFPQ